MLQQVPASPARIACPLLAATAATAAAAASSYLAVFAPFVAATVTQPRPDIPPDICPLIRVRV